MKLNGKAAIVTGGASGIGRASVRLFAKEGASVAIVDLNSSEGEKTRQALSESGAKAFFIRGDVSKVGEAKSIVETAVEKLGRLDILLNAAGVFLFKSIADTTEEDWERVIGTDLKAVYFMSKYALAAMEKSGSGAIVNISSGAGPLMGVPLNSAYCAAKAGVTGMTRALALDYARKGIRVNCICPGVIDTPMSRGAFASLPDPDRLRTMYEQETPVGRFGVPEEIAAMALFLASDDASYMTGAIVPVDGGLSA
jgi:meso-butanediol dehydrogenase / (S,S)-butanediol dehydrogenase / diacetyl reductase